LQVTDDVHAAKAPIQQQITRSDTGAGRCPQQALQYRRQGVVAADRREGDREASAFADDIGGGVGVEVTGTALGLAAVDLAAVVQGLAVVGNEREVNGQGLATA
jgi:hypothetical protein